WHTGPISRANRPPHPRERGGQLAPSAHLHSGRRDDCGGLGKGVEGKASLAAARRMARCRIAEGPPAGVLRGPEGVAAPRPDRRARGGGPTAAGPIPRGVPRRRIPDPAVEDASRAPRERPETLSLDRGC